MFSRLRVLASGIRGFFACPRGLPWLETFLQDVRFGLRILRKNPSFTAVAALTLALGIGANTAIFSVVNAVLLKPLRATEPDRVVIFEDTTKSGSGFWAADIEFNMWRRETSVFEEVSGYRSSSYYLTSVDQPQKVEAMLVTEDYFRLFGLPIIRGRGFTPEEQQSTGRLFENGHAAVLSDGFWRRAFGGDPRILGKVISLNGNPYEIVGIMAPGIRTETPEQPDVWLPFPISSSSNDQVHYFAAVGRLKRGVTLEMADSQLKLMTQEFRREYPYTVSAKRGDVYSVERMGVAIVRDVRFSLLGLAGAVGFVLLIACANTANMLVARAASRTREMAIRTALGATRGRIIRQLLVESMLISGAAALLGLGTGLVGIHALLSLVPTSIPRLGANGSNVALDWRVLWFTVLITVLTGVLVGLFPGISASRRNPISGLIRSSGRGDGLLQSKARSLLVIFEVSLSLVLLIAAALLIRTLIALRSVKPGFEPHSVLMTQTPLDPKLLRSPDVDQVTQNAFQNLNHLPGVEEAAFTTILPLGSDFNSLPMSVAGQDLDRASQGFGSRIFVSPNYFKVLKIPLLEGRVFTEADSLNAPAVAIINEALARELWQGRRRVIGAQIIIGKGLGPGLLEPVRGVVGIVGDVRNRGLGLPPQPTAFIPAAQRADAFWTDITVTWVVRTRAQSPSLATAIQNALGQTTGLPVPPLHPMEEVIAQSTGRQNFNMTLMSIFGGAALLLAAIGIYGVIAYLVVQRTHEIGIRMALGASRRSVGNMILAEAASLMLIGMVVGVSAALALTRMMTSLLYGVKPWDPIAFGIVVILLASVAIIAAYVPARRAMRVDPMVALRHE